MSASADPSVRCRDVNRRTLQPKRVTRFILSWSATNPAPRVWRPPPGTHAPPSTSTASIRSGQAKSKRQRRRSCLAKGYSGSGSGNPDALIRTRSLSSSGDGGRGVLVFGSGAGRGKGGSGGVHDVDRAAPVHRRGLDWSPVPGFPPGSGPKIASRGAGWANPRQPHRPSTHR